MHILLNAFAGFPALILRKKHSFVKHSNIACKYSKKYYYAINKISFTFNPVSPSPM